MGYGWGIEKAQGYCPVLFPYWYAIKPATPLTKMYSVFRCSNFNDIGGANEIRTRDLLNAIQARYQLRHNPVYTRKCGVFSKSKGSRPCKWWR